MKTLILLLVVANALSMSTSHEHRKELLLTCQGKENFSRDNPRPADIYSLREEMENLIRGGSIPIVIEIDRDVAWIFLNDPMGRDYPEADFQSDYFEIIMDLFPLKINKELKKNLKSGNKVFMEALGIEYLVENGEVLSLIDYERFESFMFGRPTKLTKKNIKKADYLWSAFN